MEKSSRLRTIERRFDWFVLENEDYVTLRPTGRGLLHSRAFPGLVLDVGALLAMNSTKVLLCSNALSPR